MGQRHNRRRSRGRHNQTKFIQSYYKQEAIEALDIVERDEALPLFRNLSSLQARHWRQRYVQWQDRQREREGGHHKEAETLEAEQQRVFGGEVGDEVSLCYPMLMVVVGLFGGIDYEDP